MNEEPSTATPTSLKKSQSAQVTQGSPLSTSVSSSSNTQQQDYEIMALRQAVLEFREEIIQKKKKREENASMKSGKRFQNIFSNENNSVN